MFDVLCYLKTNNNNFIVRIYLLHIFSSCNVIIIITLIFVWMAIGIFRSEIIFIYHSDRNFPTGIKLTFPVGIFRSEIKWVFRSEFSGRNFSHRNFVFSDRKKFHSDRKSIFWGYHFLILQFNCIRYFLETFQNKS